MKKIASRAAAGMGLLLAAGAQAEVPRMIRKEVELRAPLEAVWRAWTTPEGLAFISKKSNVELKVGGPFELFLDGPADERGRRGSEGSRVLAFLPSEMLAFEWTFPPSVPTLRNAGASTQCVVLFDDLGDGRVRVRFAEHGWGAGADWDAGYAYFDQAWGFVLERLKVSLETPPPAEARSTPPR